MIAPRRDDTVAGDPEPAQARWFGSEDEPLFAVVHRPPGGRARGGVVLCPPIATELNFSYRLLRTLATRLAARGLLVVRFDYAGTGQSAGETNGCERRAGYLNSIAAAFAFAHAEGAGWVAGVGLRLGATLLAAAVDAGTELDALLLWDPCLSGRGFLREQRTLLAASGAHVRDPADGSEVSGYLYTPSTSEDLGRLELPSGLAGLHGPGAVVYDEGRPGVARMRRRLAVPGLEWAGYRLDGPLLDTGLLDHDLPELALGPVLAWLDEHAPTGDGALTETEPRTSSIVAHAADGTPIQERMLRLGPGRLFAIETRGAVRDDLPAIVFLSIAAEPSVGPGRMWVDLARRLAAEGRRCVRVDLSGIGESPARPGEPERVIYSPRVPQDVEEACAAIDPDATMPPVLVGVCSGAYAILVTAPRVPVSGAVAINPYLTLRALDGWSAAEPADAAEPVDGLLARTRRPALAVLRRLAGRISRLGRNVEWRERLLDRLPTAVWRVLVALRLAFSPATLIAPVLDAGVPLLLISGDTEGRQATTRAPGVFRRIGRAPHSRFLLVPEIDHSLRVLDSRQLAQTAITQFVATLPPARSAAEDISAASTTRAPSAISPESILPKAGVLG